MKYVKAFILAVVVAGLMYAIVNYDDGGITVERVENLEVETPVEEVPAWQKDEEAIKAAQDVIKKKELQAQLEAVDKETADVKATYEAETAKLKAAYDAKISELKTSRTSLVTELDSY